MKLRFARHTTRRRRGHGAKCIVFRVGWWSGSADLPDLPLPPWVREGLGKQEYLRFPRGVTLGPACRAGGEDLGVSVAACCIEDLGTPPSPTLSSCQASQCGNRTRKYLVQDGMGPCPLDNLSEFRGKYMPLSHAYTHALTDSQHLLVAQVCPLPTPHHPQLGADCPSPTDPPEPNFPPRCAPDPPYRRRHPAWPKSERSVAPGRGNRYGTRAPKCRWQGQWTLTWQQLNRINPAAF
jgi:hypothetical protein